MHAMSGVTKRLILDYLTRSRDIVRAAIGDPAFPARSGISPKSPRLPSATAASFFRPATAEAQLTLSTLLERCCLGSIMIAPPLRRSH
jgi:hypothetical protein